MNHNMIAALFVYLFRALGVFFVCNSARHFIDVLVPNRERRKQIMFSLFLGLMIVALTI